MMHVKTRMAVAATAVASGLLAVLPPAAYAQERVEITGSRIRTPGAVSNSPITSITVEEMNATQPVAVEEVIRGLPAAIPAIGPGTNNGSNGTASVDLRGLGTNRTLVLVNGRRLVPATLGGVVDTNSIPVALIERIDLITGGASAVYGADAVSGVVNFVLKRNFTGLEASTSYGSSENGDAKRWRTDVTMGANLAEGRGNAVLSIGTTRTDPLTQGERDFGFFSLSSTSGARQGSGTDVPSQFAITGISGNRQINPATGALDAAGPGFNFNPVNYYITPLDRTQISGMTRFVINDNAEAYAEVSYTKSAVTLNLAASGSFLNNFTIPIGNPFIPEPARQTLCTAYNISSTNCVAGNSTPITLGIGRRFTELGPRINDFDNTTYQWTVGLRGNAPLLTGWSYDANLSKGQADQVSNRINWGSLSKLRQALDATNATTCTNNTNGCVPLNVWGAAGSITPAMLNFINLSAVQTTKVTQQVAQLTVSGDVGAIKSPMAQVPLSLAVGLENRKVFGGNKSDAPSQIQGEVLGTGAPLPDRQGTIKLNEGYVEAIMPIAARRPFAHSLNLEAGYRQSEFQTQASSQNYGSWKLGGEWAPVKGLRLRAMQQRATRAPNVNELYAPVTTGLSNRAVDPCQLALINQADANTPGTLSNLCRATGVPLAQIGALPAPSAGQINNTSGGNPNLSPEEADTTTLGIVFEPDAVPGLSVSLDYYKVEIQKAVSSATTNQVIDGCYSASLNPSRDPGAPFCAFIRRNTLSGTFNGSDTIGVITQTSNLGRFNVEGYDVEVRYRLPMTRLGLSADMGRLDLSLSGNVATKWQFKSLPTVATIDCLGYYSTNCGGPTQKVKFSQRGTWTVGKFQFGYLWRHIGKSIEEPGGTAFLPAYSTIPAYNYVDLNARWDVTKNIRLAVAVNNAFDKAPPVVGNTIGTTSTNSGNTFPQWYDVVGRQYSLTATVKF